MFGRLTPVLLVIGAFGCKQATVGAALKDDTSPGGSSDLKICTEQVAAAPAGPTPASPASPSPAPAFIPPALELTDGGDFIPVASDDGNVPSNLPGPAPQTPGGTPSSSPQPGTAPSPALAETPSRSGDMKRQLAPSFFEDMVACNEAVPEITTDDGTINADGDCEYPAKGDMKFFSCHYHLGIEFAGKNELQRGKSGEIHCIFPTAKGPTVFGGHFTCKQKDGATKFEEASKHGVKGAVCKNGILKAVRDHYAACSQKKCCDDGTLTGGIKGREGKRPGTNGGDLESNLLHTVNNRLGANLQNGLAVRPDFRLCEQPVELDCDDLAVWGGHDANAPKFGAPGKFWYPTVTETGRKTYKDAKEAHPTVGH